MQNIFAEKNKIDVGKFTVHRIGTFFAFIPNVSNNFSQNSKEKVKVRKKQQQSKQKKTPIQLSTKATHKLAKKDSSKFKIE